MTTISTRIFNFYLDGFRGMRLGRILWAIIFIKLFVMFGVLKPFFFQDYLEANFSSDTDRAQHVLENLTQSPTR